MMAYDGHGRSTIEWDDISMGDGYPEISQQIFPKKSLWNREPVGATNGDSQASNRISPQLHLNSLMCFLSFGHGHQSIHIIPMICRNPKRWWRREGTPCSMFWPWYRKKKTWVCPKIALLAKYTAYLHHFMFFHVFECFNCVFGLNWSNSIIFWQTRCPMFKFSKYWSQKLDGYHFMLLLDTSVRLFEIIIFLNMKLLGWIWST